MIHGMDRRHPDTGEEEEWRSDGGNRGYEVCAKSVAHDDDGLV